MKFGEIAPALKAGGWDVIPVKTKTKGPTEQSWQHGFSEERIQAFAANGYAGGNTGLLAKHFPGVDIDVPDPLVSRMLFELSTNVLGPAPVRVGSAPKCLMVYGTNEPFAKVKVFLAAPDGSTRGADGKEYAVEILGDGQQYIIYGEHPDGFQYRWPRGGDPATSDVWDLTQITRDDVQRFIDAIPDALAAIGWTVVSSRGGSAAANAGDAFEAYKQPLDGWDLERVRSELLPHLDADGSYEDWLRVGQCLHHQGEGDPEWLQVWDEWSAGSGKYTEGLCERKWDGFQTVRTAGAVTLASLLHETKAAREAAAVVVRVDATAAHRAAVVAAPDEAAVRDAAQRIALDSSLDKLARDTLAGVIQGKLREITGVRPRIETVRGMVTLQGAGAGIGAVAIDVEAPEWAQPWVYATAQAKFFNKDTKEAITHQAFDAAHSRWLPPDDNGNIPQASRVACDVWRIPVVSDSMYLPSAGDIFKIDGKEYVNTYRPDLVPTAVFDAVAAKVLLRHIELLVPDPVYRAHVLQWMAWVVRNPGLKVLWAMLFVGVEGDGKSILGSMMSQAMGQANVGIISPDTLAGSTFNDWAVGRCLNVIEELKLQGHNRHDVYNKIKPLITNLMIELHGKGKAATTAVNTANYLAFSNHRDAIPLDEHDRRQFVLFTPWSSISELHHAISALGMTADRYWDELWDVVKNRPDAVRGFFESIDLTGFDPHSRAPASTFKDEVVAAGDLDDAEALAKYHIEEGAYGVSASILSSSCLTKVLAERDTPVVFHTTRVRKLLTGLGFEQVPGFLKWKGAAHRVWIRDSRQVTGSPLRGASFATLRAALDETVASVASEIEEDFLK